MEDWAKKLVLTSVLILQSDIDLATASKYPNEDYAGKNSRKLAITRKMCLEI